MSESTYKNFEFIGVPSGDGESFCFEVDKEMFVAVTGRQPDEYDYVDASYIRQKRELFRLYPNDIFGLQEEKKKLKIKIQFVQA